MNLLENALNVLLSTNDKCEILNSDEYNKYLEKFFSAFSFTTCGSISWNTLSKKTKITNVSQIIPYLNQQGLGANDPIYVIWGEDDLPIIKCNLIDVLKNIKVLTAVGTYGTWLYSPTNEMVIEFWHHGEITLGFSNRQSA